ncbi:glycosyltransferase family 2 protein [Fictibacillus nanhaiensis]|uniref:glycosyltransferase family 2 protein n=1 Tax=Fictibacillus nanhaiensis TaxID=742169 RepID=UPI002042474F|nr:glycosyltransferase family A protein [Fictibacillus nanhaiensis]MCM3733640.1 glycosyltransferase family 2 protein [Fictibacillus nanhaiensis]
MVSIICCTMREQFMENVFRNYDNQIFAEKELIIVLNHDSLHLAKWKARSVSCKNVFVYKMPSKYTLGECLNFAIQKASYPYIAKFDDDDYYAPHYLQHSWDTLQETKADVVGKRTVYMYFEDEKLLTVNSPSREKMFVRQGLKGATLFFNKKICERIHFPALNLGEDTVFLRQCVKNQLRLYSSDKRNYVCIRSLRSGHHTWNIDNAALKRKSSIVCHTEDYKPLILE